MAGQTVGNLKKYLDRFPDDAKVVIVERIGLGQDLYNFNCQIEGNCLRQLKKGIVRLSAGKEVL